MVGKIDLDIEPGFIGLGARHVAVGMNNKIWYHMWRDENLELLEGENPLVCK